MLNKTSTYVRSFSSTVIGMSIDCYDLCCSFMQLRIFLFPLLIDHLRETVGEIVPLTLRKLYLQIKITYVKSKQSTLQN